MVEAVNQALSPQQPSSWFFGGKSPEKARVSSSDIVLLTGDLNVPSFEMPANFEKALMDLDKNFQPSIKLLNKEYKDILMKTLITGLKDYKPIDLLRFDFKGDPNQITFGDFYKDKQGKMQPLETRYTAEIELCSMQGLDYIFQLEPRTISPSALSVVSESIKVEKFLTS